MFLWMSERGKQCFGCVCDCGGKCHCVYYFRACSLQKSQDGKHPATRGMVLCIHFAPFKPKRNIALFPEDSKRNAIIQLISIRLFQSSRCQLVSFHSSSQTLPLFLSMYKVKEGILSGLECFFKKEEKGKTCSLKYLKLRDHICSVICLPVFTECCLLSPTSLSRVIAKEKHENFFTSHYLFLNPTLKENQSFPQMV